MAAPCKYSSPRAGGPGGPHGPVVPPAPALGCASALRGGTAQRWLWIRIQDPFRGNLTPRRWPNGSVVECQPSDYLTKLTSDEAQGGVRVQELVVMGERDGRDW